MREMTAHTVISGFSEDLGRWNGSAELTEKLRQDGHADGIDSRVHYFRWNVDWTGVAVYYDALRKRYQTRLSVGIYAYSWGAGFGAMKLASELKKRGIPVKYMVLSDPVYRHPCALLRWRALTNYNLPIIGEPIVRVPSTVGEVWSFHQTQNRPAGHKLIAASRIGGPLIHPRVLLNRTHAHMDDAPEFHAQAIKIAERLRQQRNQHG